MLNLWMHANEFSQHFTPEMTDKKLRHLSHVFHRYGPEARTCLTLAGDEARMRTRDLSIEQTIANLPADRRWMGNDLLPADVVHKVFRIQPSPNRASPHVLPASDYINRLLWRRALESNVSRAEEMFLSLIKFPFLRAGAGRMLEPIVLTMLQEIGGKYIITPMDEVDKPQYSITLVPLGDISRTTVSFESERVLTKLIPLYPDKLITPYASNYPSADAMMFTAMGNQVWLFQVTLAPNHTLSTTGLERVQRAVPAAYKAKVDRKWFYVIVTLDDQDIRSVPIQGTTVKLRRKWEGLIEKYILRVEEKKLFAAVRLK